MSQEKRNRTFVSEIMPLITINRAICLAPVAFKKDNLGGLHISTCKAAQLYSCVMLVAMSVSTFIVGHGWHNDKKPHDQIIHFYMVARLFFATLIPISCLRSLCLTIKAFAQIDALEEEVPKLAKWIFLPVLLIGLHVVDDVVWCTLGHRKPDIPNALRSFFVELVPIASCNFLCSQFICHVYVLNQSMSKLNERVLLVLMKGKSDSSRQSLRAVLSHQHKLWKVYTTLNAAYGAPLLFVTATGFLEGSVAFILFTRSRPVAEVIIGFIWAALCNVPLGFVMHTCQKAEEKFSVNRDMCYKLKITPKLSRMTGKEAYEWEVQLRHQRVSYNACGFFCLNGRQFMSMVCTIISYYFCVNWFSDLDRDE